MSEEEQPGFQVQLRTNEDMAVLEWAGQANEDLIFQAASLATDDGIMGHGIRRVEVQIPLADLPARRALHRAGFRMEGVRRSVRVDADTLVDVAMYSRLADDIAYGQAAWSSVMNSVLPKKRALSHVLFRNAADQLLFLQLRYKTDWELPGGVVEINESPHDGAAREVAEELGVAIHVGGLLAIDWLPPLEGWEDAQQFVFDGGVLSADIIERFHVDEEEIAALHWLDLEGACAQLIPGAARRLRAIVSAKQYPLYLQDGHPLA